jgi:hypothetical protein
MCVNQKVLLNVKLPLHKNAQMLNGQTSIRRLATIVPMTWSGFPSKKNYMKKDVFLTLMLMEQSHVHLSLHLSRPILNVKLPTHLKLPRGEHPLTAPLKEHPFIPSYNPTTTTTQRTPTYPTNQRTPVYPTNPPVTYNPTTTTTQRIPTTKTTNTYGGYGAPLSKPLGPYNAHLTLNAKPLRPSAGYRKPKVKSGLSRLLPFLG